MPPASTRGLRLQQDKCSNSTGSIRGEIMSGESFLQNPTAIGIAVVVAIILIALIIFLIARRRRDKSDNELRVRSELIAMERENQFAAAADHVRYGRDPNGVASELAQVFREYLETPVIAIYAGREGDRRL